MSSWSSLECSPACHAGDRGFKSHRGRFLIVARELGVRRVVIVHRCDAFESTRLARYANRQSGEAQTFVSAGSTPACATDHPSAGHWRAQVAVTHPPRAVQVRLLPDGLRLARSSIGLGHQPLKLEGRVRFGHRGAAVVYGSLRPGGEMADTRRSERRASKAWEFDSPLGHSNRLKIGGRRL